MDSIKVASLSWKYEECVLAAYDMIYDIASYDIFVCIYLNTCLLKDSSKTTLIPQFIQPTEEFLALYRAAKLVTHSEADERL